MKKRIQVTLTLEVLEETLPSELIHEIMTWLEDSFTGANVVKASAQLVTNDYTLYRVSSTYVSEQFQGE